MIQMTYQFPYFRFKVDYGYKELIPLSYQTPAWVREAVKKKRILVQTAHLCQQQIANMTRLRAGPLFESFLLKFKLRDKMLLFFTVLVVAT